MRLMRVRNHVYALSLCTCGAVCSLLCASCACETVLYAMHAPVKRLACASCCMWIRVYALHAQVERRVCALCAHRSACMGTRNCAHVSHVACMRGTVLYALHAHVRLGVCASCACNAESLLLCSYFACAQQVRMYVPGVRFMHARN